MVQIEDGLPEIIRDDIRNYQSQEKERQHEEEALNRALSRIRKKAKQTREAKDPFGPHEIEGFRSEHPVDRIVVGEVALLGDIDRDEGKHYHEKGGRDEN